MSVEWEALSEPKGLELDLSIPPIVEKFLSVRNITSKEDVEKLFISSLKDMRSPYLLKDMDLAVYRIFQAFERKEKILVYGDFDLDGSSGISLMVEGMRALGIENLSYFQPKRLSDGYGLHAHMMSNFKEQGFDLVITVDLGITAVEAAAEAKAQGLDLIITDHHQPKEVLPEAIAIVNPNRKDCLSGLGHLCGAGVAYYLLLGLKMYWDKAQIPHNFQPKDILEYFVIGTLTDMVPMLDENRSLTKHGITHLEKTKRAGLRTLLDTLGYLGRPLTGQDVAIGIAPKLNALSRMEEELLPVDILLESDELQAKKKMSRVLELNEQRKFLQKEAEEEAESEYLSKPTKNYVFVYSKNFHKGVIGLVATKLSQKYNLPAFVGTLLDTGEIVGSARSPNVESFSLLDVYEKTNRGLNRFGGHHHASGFHTHIDKVEVWKQELDKYFLSQGFLKKTIVFDVEARLSDLNRETMTWFDKLQPFGVGFEIPSFLLKSCLVSEKKVLRGGHMRLQVKQSRSTQTALLFSPPNYAMDIAEGDMVDMIVEIQWNYFSGRKSLQLLVKDIRRNEN